MSVAPPSLDVEPLPSGLDPRSPWTGPDALVAAPWSPASLTPEVPELPHDLSGITTRELRVLCNQLYRVLDTDYPPFGVQEDYEAVREVLAVREARAAERAESEKLREKFRDNAVSSRFELFHDGTVVGYIKYDMRGGRIRLLQTVVGPEYRGVGLEPVLVRAALLDAHRRRLAPVPYCPHAQAFLAENPQFQALIPVG